MTEQHPLTDEIIEKIAEDVFYYDHSIPIFKIDMRAAADWQLTKVLEWLDKNLSKFTINSYTGEFKTMNKLPEHLEKAMRPQEDNS